MYIFDTPGCIIQFEFVFRFIPSVYHLPLSPPRIWRRYVDISKMVSLPFILSSSSFSCSRSNTRKSGHSSFKSNLSSHLAGRCSYTGYHVKNSSSEQLLIPSDHSIIEPIQCYPESHGSSLSQQWYSLNHSKCTKAEEDRLSKNSGGYYLLTTTLNTDQPTQKTPRNTKRDSARMTSKSPSSPTGKKLFRASAEPREIIMPNETRRSYGIGGAGNIRKYILLYSPQA